MRFSCMTLPAALALGLSLAACGSAPPAPTPPPPAPAAATPVAAPNVADLVGARASSGEGEFERRGFTAARVRGLTSTWWHAPSRTCVEAVTSNGRYRTVRAVPAANCGM